MIASTTVSWRTRASSLVALLALAAGAASCGSTTPSRTASHAAATPPATHMLVRPSSLQRAHFALLRTRPEGLPPRVRSLVHPRGAGVNPALAQRVPVLLPGSYWLVPGIGQLCIVSQVPRTQGVGTICGSTQQAVKEGIATISFTPARRGSAATPTRLLVGVAPNGAHVALVHTRGAVAAVPVVESVFVLRDSASVPSDFVAFRRG